MRSEWNENMQDQVATLENKLRKARKLYAATRREYPEIARQERRNMQAIERQIEIARKTVRK